MVQFKIKMSKRPLNLYCFSPPVMLATFMIELGFAAYILWRYKLSTVSRLIVALLVSLGVFQASEYVICTGALGIGAGMWSKLGYSAISLLPPLGIHLSMAITQKYNKTALYAAYATCAAFVAYITFYTASITGATCYANYVVFDTSNQAIGLLYALYYYGWLFTGVAIAWNRATGKHKAPLYALMAGYVSFILPTTLFNLIEPSTISAIPSIMCGFAVLLAFALTLKVAPETLTPKTADVPKKVLSEL